MTHPQDGPVTPALDSVVGLDENEAADAYRAQGYDVRTLAPDAMITLEYKSGRINLTVADGKVLRAHEG